MKYIIYKIQNNQIQEKLGSYEGPKDESSTHRSYLLCPPHAIHLELPEGIDEDCVEPVLLAETLEQIGVPAKWSNGIDTVYNPNDIPTLVDEEGNPSLDPSYKFIPGIDHIPASPARYALVLKTELVLAKKQKKAEEVLEIIRQLREPLLKDSDVAIFKLEDDGKDSSKMREYRKELRSCTDNLKEEDGKAKFSCIEIIPSEFNFPKKP
jgi:hypothetical protein